MQMPAPKLSDPLLRHAEGATRVRPPGSSRSSVMQIWPRLGRTVKTFAATMAASAPAAPGTSESAAKPYAYRMRAWPEIPPHVRTAPVLRAMSRMSWGPLTHGWILRNCGLSEGQAECLIDLLVAEGAVERFELGAPVASTGPTRTSAVAAN